MTRIKRKNTGASVAGDLLADLFCGLMFAIGLCCFTHPNRIAPGGVSGVAVLLNYLFHIPLGVSILGINVPLLILSRIHIGRRFAGRSLVTILIESFLVDLLTPVLPAYRGDSLLASIFGGVCIGLGIASVFRRGSTTGGTDIVSRLIQIRYPYMQIGMLMFVVDSAVVAASIVTFRRLETGLYSVLAVFVTGRIVDFIMGGANMGRMIIIISNEHHAIAAAIMDQMHRGATLLEGSGAYSGTPSKVVLCAVRISEYPRVHQIVRDLDPHAFLITTNVNEILGEGFTTIGAERLT